MDAVERALAAIEAAGRVAAARTARENAMIEVDRRVAIARAVQAPAPEITADGYEGFKQVVADLASHAHWRNKQASAVEMARISQIKGHNRATVRMWLEKAARARRSAIHYLRVETSMAHLAAVDAALSLPLEHDEAA